MHRLNSSPTILVSFTECIACRYYTNSNGPIQIFLSSFTKEKFYDNSVTDINPIETIEKHIVISAFERYFIYSDYMFPQPVTFHSSAEQIQYLILARLIPKLRGMYNHWTG